MRKMQSRTDEAGANKLSVKLELQADFYAGIWAHYDQKMNNMLEEGDIEEALSAANAVGDDAIQKKAQGHVVPDSFTHGTSEQRMYWFKKGFESGDIHQGEYSSIK
jgi:predicted metalloprotease